MMQNPIVVLGSGPAGMAAALGLIKSGHDVVVYERYKMARPAGNILNLWPPPIKALMDMGVDISEIGAPCTTVFNNASGHKRAEVHIPNQIIKEYGGGFVGLLRPDLYTRMLHAIPEGTIHFDSHVSKIHDHGEYVTLEFNNGTTVDTPLLIGADGIDSIVRRHNWGPEEKRPHNLNLIGGFTFDTSVVNETNEVAIHHSRTVQGTWSSIRSENRNGVQWWFVEGWPDDKPAPMDLAAHASKLAVEFPDRLQRILKATPKENIQTWKIRDMVPIKKWSKGRVSLAGDAAHATSPYAAYGAGMSICDGYYLGQCLHGTDLNYTAAVTKALDRYDAVRIPHTTKQVSAAYFLGQLFHHTPWYLRPVRDMLLDYTPFLQRQVGNKNPQEILEQLDEMGEGILKPKLA